MFYFSKDKNVRRFYAGMFSIWSNKKQTSGRTFSEDAQSGGDGLFDALVFIFLPRFHQINQQKRMVMLHSLTGGMTDTFKEVD